MKKNVLNILLLLLMIMSCKQEKAIQKENELSNTWIQEMQLDNNDKWIANKETTEGILNMQSLINKAKTSTLEDYNQLGDKLKEESNLIIKQCTMKGAAHDNLHTFLLPLIDKINVLQEVSLPEKGHSILELTKTHLDAYHQFFR